MSKQAAALISATVLVRKNSDIDSENILRNVGFRAALWTVGLELMFKRSKLMKSGFQWEASV